MKNEAEIKNQMNILNELDKELDKYDTKIDELINTKDLEEGLRNCPPKKRAEVYWTAAYGIYTNKYLEFLLEEKDPQLHPIKNEINRLNQFRKKLINAEKEKEEENKQEDNNKKKKKKKDNIYQQIKELNTKNSN